MYKFIRHLFIPHTGNNHRSKILHNSSLFFIVVLLLFSSWVSIIVNKTHPEILGISYSISDQELLLLVNERRVENGLEPLKLNQKLMEAAQDKARNMFENNYWAHFSPNGTTPWSFITKSGYDYLYAGENLAKGFVNSDEIVEAWMNSESHRENLLSPQYKDMGFAIMEGELEGEETVLVVQMFGQERNQFLAQKEPNIESVVVKDVEAQIGSGVDVNTTAEVPLLGTASSSNFTINSIAENLYKSNPKIDVIFSVKSFAFIILSVLLLTFLLDYIIVVKNKIPRMVGDNIDHILVISIFIVFLLVHNMGVIL